MTRIDPADTDKFEKQDIKEVWFTGCHSDVGGGSDVPSTSRVALRWMLGEAANVTPALAINTTGESLLCEKDPPGLLLIDKSWSTAWRLVEQLPRFEIDNSGKYPVTERHRGSDGARDPRLSKRAGIIAVHATALDHVPSDWQVTCSETQRLPAS